MNRVEYHVPDMFAVSYHTLVINCQIPVADQTAAVAFPSVYHE